jgi:triosephosphate isomerase
MRVPMIAGNWKMNTTLSEATRLAKETQPEIENIANIKKVLCPPFISLAAVHTLLLGSSIKTGAQNLYFEEKGAYTGEISPLMLIDLCEYVIIGHSERRLYFHETGEVLSRKVAAAIKHNLKPILCVGENLSQFEAGKTQEVVVQQIESSLAGVSEGGTLTVAYEPVWAIGTGKAANGNQANETISLIRTTLSKKYNRAVADSIPILYGGSVTAANIAEFVSQPDIDGALVGGASLKAMEFTEIVKITAKIRNLA